MNIQHIITTALIDYDSSQPVIRYLKKHTTYEGYKTSVDTKRTIFRFLDRETKNLVLETEVEVLGVFYDKYNIWSWAWSHTGLTNAENYLSKEILIYALKLGSDLSYLKSLLTTSRGEVKDRTQIDINIALGASIIKQPYIYPFEYSIGDEFKLIYYFILLNQDDLNALKEKITKTDGEDDD